MQVELDILKTQNGFDIWVSDNVGGSGISVQGTTKEEVLNKLNEYLTTYLEEVEAEE